MIIETAVMGFRVTVLWAVDVTTFTSCLDQTYFSVAFPALVGVFLNRSNSLENWFRNDKVLG